jgi:hypothetical protein
MKNKGVIVTAITVAIAIAIGSYVGQSFFSHPSIDQQMQAAANDVNKVCPVMVDQETRLDNAIAGPGKLFTYNYTLINFSIDEIDTDIFSANIRTTMKNNIRTNPEMRVFRDNKITVAYAYKDKAGNFIHKVEIPPDEYLE